MTRSAAILVGTLLVASHAWAQQPLSVGDSGVQAAIQKTFPGSTILVAADVDSRECGPAPESPGFVAGDFEGDGRPDFAALVKIGETGKVVDWEGRKLHETRYAFAIFLATSDGRYNPKRIIRFLEYWPVMTFITLQPPGMLRGPGDDRRGSAITLKSPGVELINCGKSSVVYYFSNKYVREFWTSD
jgi:hypothetical protein